MSLLVDTFGCDSRAMEICTEAAPQALSTGCTAVEDKRRLDRRGSPTRPCERAAWAGIAAASECVPCSCTDGHCAAAGRI